jgi:beta-lactamase regulating signal transducer with metallopeptidase domain/Flp pilus assembly protein TadD
VIAHLLACSLVGLAATSAALLLPRRAGAGFRHALLLCAVLRFAIPTSWLAALGARFAPRFPASPALEQLGAVLLHPGAVTLEPIVRTTGRSPEPWLILWALGAALCLGLWALRALRPVPAVRLPNQTESEILAGIPLRIIAADQVPGACGWLRPCVVLPDGLSDHLAPAELRAVVEHELAHIRRHDNLWAALVHAVVSVFWFHPLLWWMERRMLAERETACDEMVLRAGAEPADYVAGLAKVCRMSFAGAAGYAGITGSSLATRMEQIMTLPFHRPSSPFPRAAAGASLAILMLLPLAAGFLRAQGASPQKDPPMFQAGLDAMSAGRLDEAYEDFSKVQEAYPLPNHRGLLGMVEVRIKQSRNAEAIALLDSAIAQRPLTSLKLALGNVLVRTGDYQRALDVFRDLQQNGGLAPEAKETGDVYLRIGETYRRMKNYDAAIGALTKARELLPDSVQAASTLALTLDAAGRPNEAAAAYDDTLKLSPNNGVALNNMAYLIAERGGDLDLALDYAQRARQVLSNSPEADDTLGWIYLKRKQPADAFSAFRTAYEQNPGTAAFRTHLAMALDQKGDTSKEAEQLKTLLRQPDSTQNQQLVRMLLQSIQ